MKGTFKALVAATAVATLAGCSSFGTVEIAERDSYAQPGWYASCAQSGSEGFFWWKEEYAYACGAGESIHQQAAEEQMYAIAMNNFAKRINGTVNSSTKLDFVNDVKTTRTTIQYNVVDTAITQHLEEERGTYKYAGKHYTFVKLKMPKAVFDELVTENASRRIARN
jgi:predicted small lipoprotein YifL